MEDGSTRNRLGIVGNNLDMRPIKKKKVESFNIVVRKHKKWEGRAGGTNPNGSGSDYEKGEQRKQIVNVLGSSLDDKFSSLLGR